MRIVETKVYSFSELSEDAKKKVLENLHDINVNYDWWDSTYEDAANIGLKIDSFDLERGRYCKGSLIWSAPEVAANIFRDHGDTCETFKTATNFMEQWQPVFNDYMDESSKGYESAENEDKLSELENEFLSSLLEDYRLILQNEYDYLASEEAIIESIEANNYEFTEEGKLF